VRLIQHVPTFVDGVEPKVASGTLGEILATPWVNSYLAMCDAGRFMASGRGLMVDGMRDGKRWWWVVGFFDEVPEELPVWQGPTHAPRVEPSEEMIALLREVQDAAAKLSQSAKKHNETHPTSKNGLGHKALQLVSAARRLATACSSASAPDGLRAAGLEFFRRCWEVARDIRDIEGSDIQDWGYELGLLTKVTASAPCGEGCVCEDIVGADFPTECYRPVVDGAALGSAPPEPSDEERVLADAVRAAAADTAFVREQYDGVRRVLLRLTQFRTTPPAPSVEPRVVNRSDEEFYRSQLSGIVAQAQGALSQFPELITGSPPPEPWSTQELYHVAAEVRHRGSLDNAVSYLRDALNRVGSAPRGTREDPQ